MTDADVSEEGISVHAGSAAIHIGGASALAQRVTYVGELGWELYVDPAWAVQVWDRLMAAGSQVRHPARGYRALDSLRMEKGYRYYGTDLTLLDNPFEAGLGFCVQLDKGEFNGRDALVAAREAGIKRRLRTLVVGGDEYVPIYGGEAVHGADGVVGRVRSCAYGFTAKKNLAYSYLPVEIGPGGQVQVEVFGSLVPASVTTDAVISRQGARQ